MHIIKRIREFLAVFADTLQVAGYEWTKSAISSAIVAVGVTIIALLKEVPPFQLAIGIPLVVAVMLIVATLARVWLGKARNLRIIFIGLRQKSRLTRRM